MGPQYVSRRSCRRYGTPYSKRVLGSELTTQVPPEARLPPIDRGQPQRLRDANGHVSEKIWTCPALPAGVVRPVLELSANRLAQSICFDSVAPHRLRVTGFLLLVKSFKKNYGEMTA